MLTDVAFVLVQVSVVNCPAVMVAGDAWIVALTCDGLDLVGVGVGVGVGFPTVAEPELHPLTRSVMKNNVQKLRVRPQRLDTMCSPGSTLSKDCQHRP